MLEKTAWTTDEHKSYDRRGWLYARDEFCCMGALATATAAHGEREPMVPQFNSDLSFFAAHRHAMMIAKQAYQVVVAQHAMAISGDQWERSSNIGGGSVSGGNTGSVYSGMGGGGDSEKGC
jgi:hypothetical protein